MAAELVRCRLAFRGYPAGAELITHVDLGAGDHEQLLGRVLRDAAARDGRGGIAEYEMHVETSNGQSVGLYVLTE